MITTYEATLNRFLDQIYATIDPLSPEILSTIGELCQHLRIGYLSASFFATGTGYTRKDEELPTSLVLYSSDSPIHPVALSPEEYKFLTQVSLVSPVGCHFHVHPLEGETFSEDALTRMSVILQLFISFYARKYVMKTVDQLIYFDEQGFPNLRSFNKFVRTALSDARPGEYVSSYFNLKHFSLINQQIGREQGTLVMKRYLSMLQTLTEPGSMICRLGGDNFVALVQRAGLDAFISGLTGLPVAYSDHDDRVLVSATAGLLLLNEPEDMQFPYVIDKPIAAYQIAKAGRADDDIIFYDQKIIEQKKRASRVRELFPAALAGEEFLVYYQPKISLETGELVGAEALCRWMHDGRLVSPGEFIPILEQNLSICILDFYMLEHVCRDIRRWMLDGKPVVRVSVNLSRRHMADVDLVEKILTIIDRYEIPHDLIEIELTETTTDVEFLVLQNVVNGLQKEGIHTSVDDFGIGYSSLRLIKDIPWNMLKVDKSFVPEDEEDEDSTASVMFRHVVAMAQEMGLMCIAEGVETAKQVQILKDTHCPLAQGFFFDRPLPVAEFEKRLMTHHYDIP